MDQVPELLNECLLKILSQTRERRKKDEERKDLKDLIGTLMEKIDQGDQATRNLESKLDTLLQSEWNSVRESVDVVGIKNHWVQTVQRATTGISTAPPPPPENVGESSE